MLLAVKVARVMLDKFRVVHLVIGYGTSPREEMRRQRGEPLLSPVLTLFGQHFPVLVALDLTTTSEVFTSFIPRKVSR